MDPLLLKALPIVGRVVLVFLMIPTLCYLILAEIRFYAATILRPEAIGETFGGLIVPLLGFLLLIWLFRILSVKSSGSH